MNYEATARTNYVRWTDLEALKRLAKDQINIAEY